MNNVIVVAIILPVNEELRGKSVVDFLNVVNYLCRSLLLWERRFL